MLETSFQGFSTEVWMLIGEQTWWLRTTLGHGETNKSLIPRGQRWCQGKLFHSGCNANIFCHPESLKHCSGLSHSEGDVFIPVPSESVGSNRNVAAPANVLGLPSPNVSFSSVSWLWLPAGLPPDPWRLLKTHKGDF